jgi:class 3 adenylate cyclase/tetratricopeptide (TPR) repeat protein
MSKLADPPKSGEATTAGPGPAAPPAQEHAERVVPYLARVLQLHLLADPDTPYWTAEGTALFADVSGFTQLSEQLARKGREGAEQITDTIGGSFASILKVAYENGASLLKFGGDALLLWFQGEDHASRACAAALRMRGRLDDVGRIELPDAKVTLRMSQGVHSGKFHFFAIGTSHLEMLPTGPAWSRTVAMEHAAEAGEILVSAETAAFLPGGLLGDPKASGVLLIHEPPGHDEKIPYIPRPKMPPEPLLRCLSPAIRAHVLAGGGTSEHRPVAIAFIRVEGTDALIEQKGVAAAAEALHRVVSVVEAATEEQGIAFLGSDVDADGCKLILTAGAPTVMGDDEDRMLLALRKIVESPLHVPLRIGVHRGAVFAGDIGPAYRRTYTVMGDSVNLTARLMARAEPGQIFATADILDRANTLFATTKLEPFAVKGKAEPVQAWSVGRAEGSRTRQVTLQRLPLTGRNAELGVIRKAFTSARSGTGRLIELVGDTGIGKTRLLEALRDAAAGFNKQHATCEAYTSSIPYVVWRELLREMLAFGRESDEADIVDRIRTEVATKAPDLAPWLPLLAAVFDVEIADTPEVLQLAEKNRRTKLHEAVARFLEVVFPEKLLVEIDDAHHMDEASAELLAYLTGGLAAQPWLFAIARRQSGAGFEAAQAPEVVRIDLKPIAPQDALRLAELATAQSPLPPHVLEVVATRSGGNPQFLRDLLRAAIDSGGIAELPESAEAATMTLIDTLAPDERALVRRVAVFGLTFHPRMLPWLYSEDDGPAPDASALVKLLELFDEEPDGYLRFRQTLLRDSAYEGLPFKLRRQLHSAVAAHIEEEMDFPEEAGAILSLHYFEAGEYRSAWQYANAAAKRAEAVYANVEAAGLYSRALAAGHQLEDMDGAEFANAQQALGDAWYKAGEFHKASEAYVAARGLVASDALADAELLLKLSHVEAKLGKYEFARKWAEQGRTTLKGLDSKEAALEAARASAWCGILLQYEGRTKEALECAERTVAEAQAVEDPEALGDAYFVMGWAYGELGKEGALGLMQRSLELYQKSGNRNRQADVLANIGVICGWEGSWDDALSYFERGRAEAVKIGDTVGATLARDNIADILINRGEWAEAEAVLLGNLPVWKASQFRLYLGGCLWYLGRVSLCLGRLDEALSRLEEAKSNFVEVGADEEVPAIEARIAECQIAKGNLDAALELVRGLLARATESNGVARVVPLLERVQAHALLKQGDLWGARDALEASLAAARERQDSFEAALTMLSLFALDRLEGVEPPQEMVEESRALLAKFKVRAVPPVPVPAA